jgi:hypothetical protein
MTTFEHLRRQTSPQTELKLTQSAAASPARTSVSQVRVRALMASAVASGATWFGWLAKYDRDMCLWRTSQASWDDEGDFHVYSEPWPRSGMMRSGIAYRLRTLAHLITGTGSGLLPTPSGVNGGRNHTSGRLDEWGGSSNPFRGTAVGNLHSPSFEEWMMGYPEGWTDVTPCETP